MRLYGVTWSAYVSNSQSAGIGQAAASLSRDSKRDAWSAGYSAVPMSVNGVRADGIAMPARPRWLAAGPCPSGVTCRRALTRIALGEHTLAATHARIGRTIEVSLASFPPRRLRIVGHRRVSHAERMP